MPARMAHSTTVSEVADVEALLEIGLEQLGHDLVLDARSWRSSGRGGATARCWACDGCARTGIRCRPRGRSRRSPGRSGAAGRRRRTWRARSRRASCLSGGMSGLSWNGRRGDRDVGAAAQRQRALEAPLADVAPRTDRVGNDVDINHDASLRFSRQCRKRAAAATTPARWMSAMQRRGQPPVATSAPVIGGPSEAADVGALHQQAR